MTYQELRRQLRPYQSLLELEEVVPHYNRLRLRMFFTSLALACFVWAVFQPDNLRVRGAFMIFFGIDLIIVMLEAFYYSYFDKIMKTGTSFNVVRLFFSPRKDDATFSFLTSECGLMVMKSVGVSKEKVDEFIGNRHFFTDVNSLNFDDESGQINLSSYSSAIYDVDPYFSLFLTKRGISKADLIAASLEVEQSENEKISEERWWLWQSLGRIPGVAKNWTEVRTHVLDKYGYDVTDAMSYGHDYSDDFLMKNRVNKLEKILNHKKSANAVVVGDDEDERLGVVHGLAKNIHSGKVFPNIEHKKVFMIDGMSILEKSSSKKHFENEFSSVLDQGALPKNTILAITQFPALHLGAKMIESDVSSLMGPHAKGTALQIIILTDKNSYDRYLSSHPEIQEHFEPIHLV